jgi:ABC-type dipeptide/oligopeptide/nickel transport system ATPase component
VAAPVADELFAVDGLAVGFATAGGPTRVLDGVSFALRAGETMGLVGESGAGKSLLIWSAVGLTPPPGQIVAGEVRFRGDRIAGRGAGDDEERLRHVRGVEIGLIVQNARAHLNPLVRVGDQLANVVRAHGELSRDAARRRAIELLAQVALNDPERTARSYPHELSGGMAQRVLIAMATINSPAVVLADEPTMGLDVTIQTQVLDLLTAEARRLGTALCIVTRDLGIVAHYCQTVGVLHNGAIVELAPVAEFFARPRHPHSARLLDAATFQQRARTAVEVSRS